MKSTELDIDTLLKTLASFDEKLKKEDEILTTIRYELTELFWDLIELREKIYSSKQKNAKKITIYTKTNV